MEFATLTIFLLMVLGAFLLSILLEAILLYWGAALASIQSRTLWKAFGAVFLSNVAAVFLIVPLGLIIPIPGTGAGTVIAFFLSILIVAGIFQTSFTRALMASIFAWVIGKAILLALIILSALALGITAAALSA